MLNAVFDKWLRAPESGALSFRLGAEYLAIGQYAAAYTMLQRAVESDVDIVDQTMKHEAFLQLAAIHRRFGDRDTMERVWLTHAVIEFPASPQACFALSAMEERNKNYLQAYYWAQLGMSRPQHGQHMLRVELPAGADIFEYYKYGNNLQAAVAEWWIGRRHDARKNLQEILNFPDVCDHIRGRVVYNLENFFSHVSAQV